MKVFRFGKFYEYDESYAQDGWSNEQILKAAAFFATCKHFNYDEILCYNLSSMYILLEGNNPSQPELCYEKNHMDLLESIKNRVERA